LKNFIYDRKFGIYYETKELYDKCQDLLRYGCSKESCTAVYSTYADLKRHIRTEHPGFSHWYLFFLKKNEIASI